MNLTDELLSSFNQIPHTLRSDSDARLLAIMAEELLSLRKAAYEDADNPYGREWFNKHAKRFVEIKP